MKLTVSFARIKKKHRSPDSGLNVPATIFCFVFNGIHSKTVYLLGRKMRTLQTSHRSSEPSPAPTLRVCRRRRRRRSSDEPNNLLSPVVSQRRAPPPPANEVMRCVVIYLFFLAASQ